MKWRVYLACVSLGLMLLLAEFTMSHAATDAAGFAFCAIMLCSAFRRQVPAVSGGPLFRGTAASAMPLMATMGSGAQTEPDRPTQPHRCGANAVSPRRAPGNDAAAPSTDPGSNVTDDPTLMHRIVAPHPADITVQINEVGGLQREAGPAARRGAVPHVAADRDRGISQGPVDASWPEGRWALLAKTCLDRLMAMIMLLVFSPLLAALAVSVASTSPGPVIFRQVRRGWQGRDFTVLKFRTMVHQPNGPTSKTQTRRRDPRCTPLGRFLRAYSLDELPQLWNVLRGEMSLVGPRPHAESLHDIDAVGREVLADYAQRYRMKPGITGWAQINGLRGPTLTADHLRRRIEHDLYYIEHWSFWLDLRILAITPFRLAGENAF